MNKIMQYAISTFFVAALVLGWGLRFVGLEPDILLHGSFIPSQMPKFEMKSLLTGQYQTQFDAYIKENFPFRNVYLKAYNQTIYQVFGQSPLKSVEIGSDNVLFERNYLQDYFGLDSEKDDQFFQDMIADMEYIQEAFEKNGKFFYLFITPSKADFYPEYAPVKYRYVKKPDGYQRNYDKLVGYLKNSKLHYFDCAAYLKKVQASEDIQLFPKTGTHWSRVTAAIAMAQFTREFAKTYGPGVLPVIQYEGSKESPPDTERDIYLLMNTLQRFSDKNYSNETYHAPIVKAIEGSGAIGYSVFCQGGSFQYEFLTALQNEFHGAINRIQNKELVYNNQPVVLNSLDELDMKKLLQHDVLLLECNQAATLGVNATFIKLLKEYIQNNGIPPKEITSRVWTPNLPVDPRTYGVYADGWTAQRAGICLKNEAIKLSGITLILRANLSALREVAANQPDAKRPIVEIRVNGKLTQTVELDQWEKVVHIPSNQFADPLDDVYNIELDCSVAFRPSELPSMIGKGNPDNRELGILLKYVGG